MAAAALKRVNWSQNVEEHFLRTLQSAIQGLEMHADGLQDLTTNSCWRPDFSFLIVVDVKKKGVEKLEKGYGELWRDYNRYKESEPEEVKSFTKCIKPRACHLRLWPESSGYGFSLKSLRGQQGQHIGKVDAYSCAEAAGLKQGDKIIEVNGKYVATENHDMVVEKIKEGKSRVTLLVVGADQGRECTKCGIRITNASHNVKHIYCPATQYLYLAERNGIKRATSSTPNSNTEEQAGIFFPRVAQIQSLSQAEATEHGANFIDLDEAMQGGHLKTTTATLSDTASNSPHPVLEIVPLESAFHDHETDSYHREQAKEDDQNTLETVSEGAEQRDSEMVTVKVEPTDNDNHVTDALSSNSNSNILRNDYNNDIDNDNKEEEEEEDVKPTPQVLGVLRQRYVQHQLSSNNGDNDDDEEEEDGNESQQSASSSRQILGVLRKRYVKHAQSLSNKDDDNDDDEEKEEEEEEDDQQQSISSNRHEEEDEDEEETARRFASPSNNPNYVVVECESDDDDDEEAEDEAAAAAAAATAADDDDEQQYEEDVEEEEEEEVPKQSNQVMVDAADELEMMTTSESDKQETSDDEYKPNVRGSMKRKKRLGRPRKRRRLTPNRAVAQKSPPQGIRLSAPVKINSSSLQFKQIKPLSQVDLTRIKDQDVNIQAAVKAAIAGSTDSIKDKIGKTISMLPVPSHAITVKPRTKVDRSRLVVASREGDLQQARLQEEPMRQVSGFLPVEYMAGRRPGKRWTTKELESSITYACEICSAKFPSPTDVKNHCDEKHPNPPPRPVVAVQPKKQRLSIKNGSYVTEQSAGKYKCGVCDSRFSSAPLLVMHNRTHL